MKTLMNMKNIKLILAIVLAAFLSDTQAQNDGEITIPLSEPGQRAMVKVDIKYGGIVVKGTSRKDVLLKYKGRESKDSNSKDKEGLKRIRSGAMDLEVYESENRVVIDSDSWNKAIDLEIEVPSNADLDVSTYNSGDVYVENINGEVVAENYNGKITLINISGVALGDTYNGDVRVTFNSIKSGTPMSFTTYNGDVDITLPGASKANLKMKSKRGEIYSGFDMEITKSEPVQKQDANKGVYKVYLDDWTLAKINGGGAEFTMENANGDIYVRSK